MTQFTVIPGGRHGQAGYYAVADLPQKEPVGKSAVSSGWEEFDQIFRLYPEQFVAVTGRAGSGKSTFIFNLVVNYARLHGIRSFLYVPENEARLRGKLRKIWNDESTADEFLRGMAFVQSAVPEHYDDEPKTLSWVLDQAVTAVRQDGVDLLVIDPWNELEWARPRDMSQTEYVRECLMWLKQFNRAYNTSTILVVHPTKEGLKDGKIPSLVDCEGSLSWHNKCDNGLIVHREKDTNATRVISQKVREEPDAGSLGECWFTLDRATDVYTPQYGAVSLL